LRESDAEISAAHDQEKFWKLSLDAGSGIKVDEKLPDLDQARCILEGFFQSILMTPTTKKLDPLSPMYRGLLYASALLVIYYQEAKFGTPQATTKKLLINRTTGKSDIERSLLTAFPVDTKAAEQLVTATEVLLKTLVRSVIKGDLKMPGLEANLKALSFSLLSKTGGILDAACRTQATAVELPLAEADRKENEARKRAHRKDFIKPKSEMKHILLRPTIHVEKASVSSIESSGLRNINKMLNQLPNAVGGVFRSFNLKEISERATSVIEFLYRGTDAINHVLRERKTRIRAMIRQNRTRALKQVQGPLPATPLDAPISVEEWREAESYFLAQESEQKALETPVKLLTGVSVAASVNWKLQDLSHQLVEILQFRPSVDEQTESLPSSL
jgi:hypothetical protein